VRARRGARAATSDWMEMEKQRGMDVMGARIDAWDPDWRSRLVIAVRANHISMIPS